MGENMFFKIIKILKQDGFNILYIKIKKKLYEKFKYLKYLITKEKLYNKLEFVSSKKRLLLDNNILRKNICYKTEIINIANKVLDNKLEFLGIKICETDNKIEWNKDYLNNFYWKNKYYKNIQLTDKNFKADVKIPWEISRLHHLVFIGEAYILSNNEKFVNKFVSIINDWKKNNPYKMSVNWTCAMEVAIRAVNIITSLEFFEESKSLKKEIPNINGILYKHGEFIFENLEIVDGIKSNHYLSDICGLFWIAIYFKGFNNETKKWLEFSFKEIENEMKNEVNNDGSSYEGSTSYHKLVTELFLFTAIFAKKNGYRFSKEFDNKLKLMVEFLYNISNQDNTIPLLGDNDDGRFIILSNYYSKEKYCIDYIIDLFNGYSSKNYNFIRNEKIKYYDSKFVFEENDKLEKKFFNNITQYYYGGYYILKNNRFKLLIRCGELSFRGQGAHSHNDQLSFILSIDGKEIFIDPGTYVYNSNYEMRNKFRSTCMHNTVQIENEEQNLIDFDNLFALKERTFSKKLVFNETFFSGEHYGYFKSKGIVHKRNIEIQNNILLLNDIFYDNKKYKKTINFNLAKNCCVEIINNEIIIDSKVKIVTDMEYCVDVGKFSARYGVLEDTKRITFTTKENFCSLKLKLID